MSPFNPVNYRSAAPDVLDVVCSSAGTSVSAVRVKAQTDGVHLRVRNTSGASGVYLNYRYGDNWGYGGGDPVDDDASNRVLSLPPGPARLNCSSSEGRNEDPTVQVGVQDPARAWRGGALAAFGCSPPERSIIDWVIGPGKGRTANAAVAALVAQMDEPTTWLAVQEGYVAAQRQTYVMKREGKPWATALVAHDAHGGYTASVGDLCRAT
ncbi:hypothetical protein ACLQ2Y_25110 [Micromonospora echinospora]|uniref:hypothetical protein n=1 Tax=Micromonospora echinospora TaxID=1877 RepID=UPI003CF3062C